VHWRDRGVADGATARSSSMRWLWAAAAASALIGWQAVRRGRARARERTLHHDLHRWEGEGGQVLD